MKHDTRVRDLAARVLELEGVHCTDKDRCSAFLIAAATTAKGANLTRSRFLTIAEVIWQILGQEPDDETALEFDNTAAAATKEKTGKTRAYTAAELEGLKPPRER